MESEDDNDPAASLPTISSRAPFLPPCIPAQANQAPGNPALGLAHGLFGRASNGPAQGLGATLAGIPPTGLAGDLAWNGITSVPNCDPRLANVTANPQAPSFRTANGTVIKMNKPGPDTTLPWGEGLDRLIKFADGTGLDTVKISGGTEAKGHTPNSEHPNNHAIDVAGDNDLDDEIVRRAALDAGYTHGMYEVKPDGSTHWHLQVGPDNIINAPAYDLRKGPMKIKVYTPKAAQPLPSIAGDMKTIPPLAARVGGN